MIAAELMTFQSLQRFCTQKLFEQVLEKVVEVGLEMLGLGVRLDRRHPDAAEVRAVMLAARLEEDALGLKSSGLDGAQECVKQRHVGVTERLCHAWVQACQPFAPRPDVRVVKDMTGTGNVVPQ